MCYWQHEVVLGSFDGNIEIVIKRAQIFFSESPRHNCIRWCALFRKVEIRSTPPLSVNCMLKWQWMRVDMLLVDLNWSWSQRRYCLNCTTFDNLILRKVVKIVAIRCHRPILKLKCIKSDFGWGSAPDPTGELTALPWPLAGFKWAYF